MEFIKKLCNENVKFRIFIFFILFAVIFGIIGYFIKDKVYDIYSRNVEFHSDIRWAIGAIYIPIFVFFILFAISLLLTWKMTLKFALDKAYKKEDIIKSIKIITILIILLIICIKIIGLLKEWNEISKMMNIIEEMWQDIEQLQEDTTDKEELKTIEEQKETLNISGNYGKILQNNLIPSYTMAIMGEFIIVQLCNIYAKKRLKKT